MTPGTVALADRRPPLVLTLDLGSSAVRCGVYDSTARAVKEMEARRPHHLVTGRKGSSTVDPDALLASHCVDTAEQPGLPQKARHRHLRRRVLGLVLRAAPSRR